MKALYVIDALIAELDGLDFSDNTLRKTIYDRNGEPSELYSQVNHQQLIDLCTFDCLNRVYTKANIKEGDLSITQPALAGIKARMIGIATKYSLVDELNLLQPATASVSDISDQW